MRHFPVIALCVLASWAQAATPDTVIEWTYDTPGDLQEWHGANHISGLRVADGAMQGRIMDWDPFVVSGRFATPARP